MAAAAELARVHAAQRGQPTQARPGRQDHRTRFFQRCVAKCRGSTPAERRLWRAGIYDQIREVMSLQGNLRQQKLAVDSGYWPLYRFNPKLETEGKNPFQLDSNDPKIPLEDYIYTDGRYRILQQSDAEVAKFLLVQAQKTVTRRSQQYKKLAQMTWQE